MRYDSPIYGKIDWPWWEDLFFIGLILIPANILGGFMGWRALFLCAIIFIWCERGHWRRSQQKGDDYDSV